MSDSFLDHLSSPDQEKIRRRMRSPEEYEKLRDKVKGPEDLEREMSKNSEFAEFSLSMETEKGMKESVKSSISEGISEQGIDKVIDGKIDKKTKAALESGNFELSIDNSKDSSPKVRVQPKSGGEKGGSIDAPSGKVAEALPLKPSFQDKLFSTFKLKNKKSS